MAASYTRLAITDDRNNVSTHRLPDVRLRRHFALARSLRGQVTKHDLARRVRRSRLRAYPAAARARAGPRHLLRHRAHRGHLPASHPGYCGGWPRDWTPRVPA